MKINIEMSKKEKRVAKYLLVIVVLAYITAVFGPTFKYLIRMPSGGPPRSLSQSHKVPEKCLWDISPNLSVVLNVRRYILSETRGHDYLVNSAAPWFFQTLEHEGHYNINYIEENPECVGHLLNTKLLSNTLKTKKIIYNFYDTSSEKLVYQIIKYPESIKHPES